MISKLFLVLSFSVANFAGFDDLLKEMSKNRPELKRVKRKKELVYVLSTLTGLSTPTLSMGVSSASSLGTCFEMKSPKVMVALFLKRIGASSGCCFRTSFAVV